MKVVINSCWGGFSLSYNATMELARRKGITLYPFMYKSGFGDDAVYQLLTNEEARAERWTIHYSTSPDPLKDTYYYDGDVARNDADLVELLESWGSEQVSGNLAKLHIVEIPDGIEYTIQDYDGMEHVAEAHRTWY